MYALCVSGAVNTHGFVWNFFMRYIKNVIHSFIHLIYIYSGIVQMSLFWDSVVGGRHNVY